MKSSFKKTAHALATFLVVPAVLAYKLGASLMGADQAFSGWSQLLSLIPGLTGTYLRRAFYRQVLPKCGDDAFIGFGTILSHPTARIGHRAYVGAYCSIGDVTIEDDVLVASHVSVMNGSSQHGTDRLDVPIREQTGRMTPVTIGRDSWIGERAVVAADVGQHCVIGAGAIVTKPVPDYAIAIGVPAKVVRFREESDHAELLAESVEMEELIQAAT